MEFEKKRIGRHLLLYVRNSLHLKSLKKLKICLLSLQHYTIFRENVFRNPRQGRKDVIHGIINKRKSALRKFNKNPSRENHMHSKLARAKARRTIKDAKRSSWRQYVNKLNSRTPVKKVWDMIRKVSGKNKKSECVHIKSSNGNMCNSTKDISNALGGNFQKKNSSSNYSQQFQNIKVEKERKSELSVTKQRKI